MKNKKLKSGEIPIDPPTGQAGGKAPEVVDITKLQKVPGLGPVGIKALENEGFSNMTQIIAMLKPTELVAITGMEKDKVGAAYDYMRDALISANVIKKKTNNALELFKHRKQIKRLKTSCSTIDNLLDGGFEYGSMTEIYGENGSGKTQTSHTCVVNTIIEDEKALVLYIDTEKTFRAERILMILDGKGKLTPMPNSIVNKLIDEKPLDSEEEKIYQEITEKQIIEATPYLERIIVWEASDAYQQMMHVNNANGLISGSGVKLLIIDSGTSLFRGEFLERGSSKTKFNFMNEMLHKIKGMAETYNIPVLFINQIYNKPDQMFGKDPDIPFGGNIVGHIFHTRLKLEIVGGGKRHRMKIIKSPYLANNEALFSIGKAGIIDPIK